MVEVYIHKLVKKRGDLTSALTLLNFDMSSVTVTVPEMCVQNTKAALKNVLHVNFDDLFARLDFVAHGDLRQPVSELLVAVLVILYMIMFHLTQTTCLTKIMIQRSLQIPVLLPPLQVTFFTRIIGNTGQTSSL